MLELTNSGHSDGEKPDRATPDFGFAPEEGELKRVTAAFRRLFSRLDYPAWLEMPRGVFLLLREQAGFPERQGGKVPQDTQNETRRQTPATRPLELRK